MAPEKKPVITGDQRVADQFPRKIKGMDIELGETKTDKEIEADIDRADARNALIAAFDETNPGNRHSWKMTRQDITLIWGESAFRNGKLRPGYEYKGLPVELED